MTYTVARLANLENSTRCFFHVSSSHNKTNIHHCIVDKPFNDINVKSYCKVPFGGIFRRVRTVGPYANTGGIMIRQRSPIHIPYNPISHPDGNCPNGCFLKTK